MRSIFCASPGSLKLQRNCLQGRECGGVGGWVDISKTRGPSGGLKRTDPLDPEARPLSVGGPAADEKNRVLGAAPQACQACPSPRHRLQNASPQTGPASAALSQGQGLSPQKGSGHPSSQLGEQSPGKGGTAAEDTGDRLRPAPANEAGILGQGGLPGTKPTPSWAHPGPPHG